MAKGIELATAYISLAVETSEISKYIGAQFGDVERRVAPRAGKKIGAAMAKGFEAEAPDLTRLERDFEDAQKRIVQAEQRATTEQENLARKVEIAQQKKAEAVEKYGAESSQALTAIDRLIIAEQKLESASMRAEDEQRKLNESLEKSQTALKDARDEAGRLESSTRDSGEAADKAGREWGGFGDAVSKALSGDFKGAFSSLKREAANSADDVASEFEGAGGAAAGTGGGTGFTGAFVGGLTKFLGGAIAAAGIGKLVSDAIFAGMDVEANADRMQASLGLSEADAQAYSDIVSNIYKAGWGDSKGEVGEGIEAFLSWSPELKANEDALEDVTSKALALADVFGVDIPFMAQLASQVVQNDLAGDTSEALDLLAAGFQKVPTSLRDEYSDAISEYTPHLANLGFTGEQAFAILASSAELGQFGIDKAGDAMKEFSIRATDGSKASAEAYERIGLDADEMANKILAGGESAQQATSDIIAGLLDIEDPAAQAEAAIALFGTPLEDLGTENIPNFLSGVEDSAGALGDFDGKADEVADTLGGNTSTQVETAKRRFSELSSEVGENLIGSFKEAYDWLEVRLGPVIDWFSEEILPPVKDAFEDIWENLEEDIFPALEELWSVLSEDLGPTFIMFKDIVAAAWDNIWWAISTVWDLISGLFETIIKVLSGDFAGAWEALKNTIGTYWDNIWGKISSVWNDHIYPFLAQVGGWMDKNLLDPIKGVVGKIGDAWNGLKSLFATPINWVVDYVVNGAVRSVVNTVASALGLDWRMGQVSRITASTRSSSGPNTGGKLTSVNAFAEGGYAPAGWALVGEEGPELIDLRTPGRVYTADETAAALSLLPDRPYGAEEVGIASRALTTQDPGALRAAAGDSPRSALLPMGEPSVWDRVGGAWSDLWRGTWSTVTNIAGSAVKFVRGALGEAASLALNPVKGAIRNNVGVPFLRDGFINQLDSVIDWVKGVDRGEGEIGGRSVSSAMAPILEGLEATQVAGGGLTGPMLQALMGLGTGGGSAHPMRGFPLTSMFGPRWGGHHAGVDWAAPVGTPVGAWRDGVVTSAGWNALAGRTGIGVLLAHANGLGSYYGHLSKALVGRGSTVRAGQMLGLSGNTGRSTGPHLHFEISKGGPQRPVNPLSYLYDEGGWLEPGATAVVNKTRQPEAVLPPDQSKAFIALAQAAAGGTGMPTTFVLRVGEREFTAWLEETIDGRPAVRMVNELADGAARFRKARL